jgi:heme exporter protein B
MNIQHLTFSVLLMREIKIAFRSPQQLFLPVLFCCLVVLIFPLGLSPSPALLSSIAPGIIWVALMLAILLSLDNLFRKDLEDGFIETLFFSPRSLPTLLAGKVFGQWLVTSLPIICISIILAGTLGLPGSCFPTLLLSLLMGTLSLTFIGAISAALTAGLQQNGMLMTLLILPMYIPILIFGSNAIQNAALGTSSAPQLYMLSALLVLTLTLAPIAISASLRIGLAQ